MSVNPEDYDIKKIEDGWGHGINVYYPYTGTKWKILQNGESYVFAKKEFITKAGENMLSLKTVSLDKQAVVKLFTNKDADVIIIEKERRM